MSDPTAFDLASTGDHADPLKRRLRGQTAHGGFWLDMPFITPVAPNLWHGGTENGLILPEFITHVVSLYQWEKYTINHELVDSVTVEMYDSVDQSLHQIEELAEWVNAARADGGNVLVACQAGLNRSSLVVARALLLSGEAFDGEDAVTLMRESRSDAVLCNPAFEKWVLDHKVEQ